MELKTTLILQRFSKVKSRGGVMGCLQSTHGTLSCFVQHQINVAFSPLVFLFCWYKKARGLGQSLIFLFSLLLFSSLLPFFFSLFSSLLKSCFLLFSIFPWMLLKIGIYSTAHADVFHCRAAIDVKFLAVLLPHLKDTAVCKLQILMPCTC